MPPKSRLLYDNLSFLDLAERRVSVASSEIIELDLLDVMRCQVTWKPTQDERRRAKKRRQARLKNLELGVFVRYA